MDKVDSSEDVVDLESGGTTASTTTSDISDYRDMELDELIVTRNVSAVADTIGNKHPFISGEDAMVRISVEKKTSRDQSKTGTGSKKPRKPPLPPRGRTLNETDIKLVREISQLKRLRQASNERIKALKKKRREKASSSWASVFAAIITILFICVIVFQGNQAQSNSH